MDVVFHHFRHDPVDSAAGRAEKAHHFRTTGFRVERPFDGVDLTAQPANAVKQLLFVWPVPGFEDTELGVFMEPEVGHGTTEVYAGVQA